MNSDEKLQQRYICTHPFNSVNECIKSFRNKRIRLLHTLRQSVKEKNKKESFKLLESHIKEKNENQTTVDINAVTLSISNIDFYKMLVIPEFVLGLNNTISEETEMISDSYFFPRPSEIKNFRLSAFDRAGILRYNFDTRLCKGPTLLDAIVQNDKFYICDVLVYNGIIMASSSPDCRFFFMRSRIEESSDLIFNCVNYGNSTVSELKNAYDLVETSQSVEYDSLVFVSKTAEYVGGYNPYWLIWRDRSISKYNELGTPCRMYLDSDGILSTLDGTEVGKIDQSVYKPRKRRAIVKVNVLEVDFGTLQIKNFSLVDHPQKAYSGALPHSIRQILSRFRVDGKTLFNNLLNELSKMGLIPLDNFINIFTIAYYTSILNSLVLVISSSDARSLVSHLSTLALSLTPTFKVSKN